MEITTQELKDKIANGEKLIVDFWAPWCGPCRSMAPFFEEAARHFPLKVQFAKVDTQEHQTIAAKFSIRSIPTVMAFKNNRLVDQFSGALGTQDIVRWVQKHL